MTARVLSCLLLGGLMLGAADCGPGNEEPETALENGFDANGPRDCGSSKIEDALDLICKYFASCQKHASCGTRSEELFAGVTLGKSEKTSPGWNGFGGRGKIMADGALCMLKDLSRGSAQTTATAHLLGVPVSVKQVVGFQHFDNDAKRFDGYQQVNICLPLIGCFDAKMQSFSATVKERSPAHPKGQRCGDFPVADAYALQITAEESDQGLSADAPAIEVDMPYGKIQATPKFEYSGTLGTTLTPLSDTYYQIDRAHDEVHLSDVYGRIPGVTISAAPTDPTETGWVSQVGLGSRQADPNATPWQRDAEGGRPHRPDLDLSQARSMAEKQPVASAKTGVNLKYSPPLPDALLNDGPLDVDFYVEVRPQVDVEFASQLEMLFSEAIASPLDIGPPSLKRSYVQLLSRSEAYADFSLYAHLRLFVEVKVGPFHETLVDVDQQKTIPLATSHDGNDLVLGQASSWTEPAQEPDYLSFQTLHDGPIQSGKDHVNQCLTQRIPDPPKPVPSYTPGDGALLGKVLYPCNLCIGTPEYADDDATHHVSPYATVLYSSTTPSGPADWSCNVHHLGCFDLCRYDAVSKTLTVDQTGVQLNLYSSENLRCNESPIR